MNEKNQPLDPEMFKLVMEELRAIRKRLDDHADDNKRDITTMQRDVSKIKEDMSAHKSKLGMISAGIAMAVAAAFSWLTSSFGR